MTRFYSGGSANFDYFPVEYSDNKFYYNPYQDYSVTWATAAGNLGTINSGDSVNYEILDSKLKNMYKLGLFADIKFRIIQNNLIRHFSYKSNKSKHVSSLHIHLEKHYQSNKIVGSKI